MDYPGLDDAFLRYIDATPRSLRRIQGFYLPFFLGCQGLVVDLACGHGDFVRLLTENGVSALGVDRDQACCREARKRGANVLCEDVFSYLEGVADESLSGVFSAHLVEHLCYQDVIGLIRLAHRALKPGGIILLTTPNVRGLYPHLESFYMHFGHVTFYHPKLLTFFLDYAGFCNARIGENPRMAQPLWRTATWANPDDEVSWDGEDSAAVSPIQCGARIPSKYAGTVGRMISGVKTVAARMLIYPLLDHAARDLNEALEELQGYVRQLNANVNATHRRLMELDRSVECYVYATKGDVELDLPSQVLGEAP